MDRDMLYMYVDKKRFVDLLSEAYEMDGSVKKIEYFYRPEETYTEVVVITYPGGYQEHINVAINSHQAIAHEISLQIYGQGAVGHFKNTWEGDSGD